MTGSEQPDALVVRPIGFVRSPFTDKSAAPRQATVASETHATVEILPRHEHALADLESFDRIWLLFWFHLAKREHGDGPSRVLPPRSDRKRGVFATRSPHRPNPIGLSAVVLERVEGLVLHVRGVDLVDGTPVLDVKPYLAYADAFPDAKAGWLEVRDPRPAWAVRFEPLADAQLTWLEAAGAPGLRERVHAALVLGPQPHPYRRIRREDDGALVLAVKAWRARFRVELASTDTSHAPREPDVIVVERISSGHKPRDLAGDDPALALHRELAARFAKA